MASIAATAGVHTRAAFVLVCCLLAVSCVAAPAPFNDGRTSDSAASMKEGREQVARLSEAATRRVTKKFEDAAKAIASVRIAGRNAIAQKIADNRKDCVECKGRYFMTEKLVEQTMMDKTMTSGNHDGLWGEARSPMGGVAPAKHNNAPPHWFKPKGTWTGKMTIFGIYAGKFTADMMVAIKTALADTIGHGMAASDVDVLIDGDVQPTWASTWKQPAAPAAAAVEMPAVVRRRRRLLQQQQQQQKQGADATTHHISYNPATDAIVGKAAVDPNKLPKAKDAPRFRATAAAQQQHTPAYDANTNGIIAKASADDQAVLSKGGAGGGRGAVEAASSFSSSSSSSSSSSAGGAALSRFRATTTVNDSPVNDFGLHAEDEAFLKMLSEGKAAVPTPVHREYGLPPAAMGGGKHGTTAGNDTVVSFTVAPPTRMAEKGLELFEDAMATATWHRVDVLDNVLKRIKVNDEGFSAAKRVFVTVKGPPDAQAKKAKRAGPAEVVVAMAAAAQGKPTPTGPPKCGKKKSADGSQLVLSLPGWPSKSMLDKLPEMCVPSGPLTKLAVRCCDTRGSGKVNHAEYGCHMSKTFEEANEICTFAGLRLCTRAEIFSCKTCHTGCGFDSRRVWTSTV